MWLCLSFIIGIFISSTVSIPQLLMLGFLILGILLISVFWPFGKLRASTRRKQLTVIGFCLIFIVIGIWRHQSAELRILNSELRKFNDLDNEISLTGIVSTEPSIGEKSIKLIIDNPKAETKEDSVVLDGKVLVTSPRYPEYKYGDKLKVIGKLETPQIFEGFNYRDYLKKDGIYSVMYFPEIKILARGLGNPLMNTLLSFKNKFKEASQILISPPQEGILEALVFGDEENISKEWKDKLNLTGTRHITAVSGMNITILCFLILSFALNLGLWRSQAFYLSIFLIIIYILMIGAPASAVRAGIMGSILMIAQYFGRLSAASRAVVFAAFIMLIFNPLLLRLDVGFQLSFLAILGIIYLQPIFSEFLKKIPNPNIFPIRTTLSATLSAQIFALPILVYNFGQISLISPIANVLIVPFLAFLTILIFTFGITAIIFFPLGFLLSLPTWLSLAYVTKIVDFFSKIPFMSLMLKNIHPVRNILTLGGISNGVHWLWLLIFYLILIFFTWRLNEKQKLKFLNY